jgi:hypothetical protein
MSADAAAWQAQMDEAMQLLRAEAEAAVAEMQAA